MNGFLVARPPPPRSARAMLHRRARLTRPPRRREERTMKRSTRRRALCLLVPFWLGPRIASAQEARAEQKTLSPYFLVEGADPSLDALPLKDTRVELTVVGVIADVTVRQVYEDRRRGLGCGPLCREPLHPPGGAAPQRASPLGAALHRRAPA